MHVLSLSRGDPDGVIGNGKKTASN